MPDASALGHTRPDHSQDSSSTQASSITARLPTSMHLQGCATLNPPYQKATIDSWAGIYPREPRSKKKASKSSTPSTTFYYTRDIQYLLHEPLLAKFRDHKALGKKISRHLGRGEVGDAARLEKKGATKLSLDHIIKERYPTVSSQLNTHEFLDSGWWDFADCTWYLSLSTLCATLTMHCPCYSSSPICHPRPMSHRRP